MAGKSVKRKLTEFFAADVEGYSRFISLDEEAKLCILGGCREFIGSNIIRRIAATLTPRSAVPRVARHVNPSGTRPC